jgi:hypothetical protein
MTYTLQGQAPRQVRDRINLATTPCNFGGERARFICPGCLTNRDVLFCVGGVFRCRNATTSPMPLPEKTIWTAPPGAFASCRRNWGTSTVILG